MWGTGRSTKTTDLAQHPLFKLVSLADFHNLREEEKRRLCWEILSGTLHCFVKISLELFFTESVLAVKRRSCCCCFPCYWRSWRTLWWVEISSGYQSVNSGEWATIWAFRWTLDQIRSCREWGVLLYAYPPSKRSFRREPTCLICSQRWFHRSFLNWIVPNSCRWGLSKRVQ